MPQRRDRSGTRKGLVVLGGRKASQTGAVWLVGAGPGDPELLTIKALKALERADVVVHDGLVSDEILALAPPHAQRISVAKRKSRHSYSQDEINRMLVAFAREGLSVVRLKGGDPFIFGRGGEEVEACREAGVPVEVVPGVSAALGCAAEAMLPLTHRDAASAVSFVAGQCKGLTEQDWSGLAGQGRTLVIYMGVATGADIADKLIADGVSPDMPVAVLENGTRPGCPNVCSKARLARNVRPPPHNLSRGNCALSMRQTCRPAAASV